MTTFPGMPPDVKAQFDRLHEYAFELRYDWATFLALYGTASEVEILNKVAPEFFGVEQGRLRDTVVLGVARLFDPAFSMGNATKTNLTLLGLADLLKPVQPVLASKIENAFGKAAVEADPVKTAIKDERHKRIAHLDRATAFGNNILPDVTRDEIEAVISEIEATMNQVDMELRDTETDYEFVTSQANQHAHRLLHKMAVVADMTPQELVKRRRNSGLVSPGDVDV